MDEQIQRNLEDIRREIAQTARACGRDPKNIRLMAVSKNQTRDAIATAYNAGIHLFGENRVQEAREKFNHSFPDLDLHLIGHLQRNKAKIAAELFTCVHSIDKIETLKALQGPLERLNKTMDILFEVNTSGETTKMGLKTEEQLLRLAGEAKAMEVFRIRGLMTMAPFTDKTEMVRASFKRLKTAYERLEQQFGDIHLDTLSMGMSADYKIAIEEGSTLVRLGTALFGARIYR